LVTIKQRRYIENLGKYPSKREAALAAGYTESMANVPGQKIESCSAVQNFYKKHLSDEKLLKILENGLEAFKVIYDNKGEPKKLPDFHVIHRYLDTAYKILGTYAPEKIQQTNLTLHAWLNGEDNEEEL
jgi:uncharacterized protein YozE (UPF0346 family)